MPQDYQSGWLLAVPSPPGRAAAPVSTVLPVAMEPWPVHQTCYLSQTCCFQLSRDSRSGRDTLNDRLWKANWHLLLSFWLAAPSTTTVIIIIWPCWSFMNIWTSWPCSVIISTLTCVVECVLCEHTVCMCIFAAYSMCPVTAVHHRMREQHRALSAEPRPHTHTHPCLVNDHLRGGASRKAKQTMILSQPEVEIPAEKQQ